MKKTLTFVKALAFAIAVSTPISFVHAQNIRNNTETIISNLPKISKTSSMGNFYANFSGQDISSAFLSDHFGEWLGADTNHSFKLVKESTDELGIKHKVYQHYFNGVKVADEFLLLHEKNGKLTFVNGEISSKINVPLGSPISEMEAEKIALADMKARGNTKFSDYEHVISKVNTARGVEIHSAAKISGFSLKPLNAFDYYIDNNTKESFKSV